MTTLLRSACLVCLLCFFGTAGASAATITVTSSADTGAGTLRAAIASAVSGDTIEFALGAGTTITLSSELAVSSKDLYIHGPGADQLTVKGISGIRVFSFIASTVGSTISGLTITKGSVNAANGGGIYLSGGSLAVIGCVVTDNTAGMGGGIFAAGGTRLKVIDSVISNNTGTQLGGGGIVVGGTGSGAAVATVVRSTISGNSAQSTSSGAGGGGIWAGGTGISTSLYLINSRITGNTTGNYGGGISSAGLVSIQGGSVDANTAAGEGGGLIVTGTSSLTDVAVTGNTVNDALVGFAAGGGIFNDGTCTLVRCTVSGNKTISTSVAQSGGGGIYDTGILTASNCTISGNSIAAGLGSGLIHNSINMNASLESCTIAFNVCLATSGGVGVFAAPTGNNTFSCHNTLIAKNTGGNSSGTAAGGLDTSGTFTSGGYNLIGSNGAAGFTNGAKGDKVGTTAAPINPMLDPLADNGGPTFTHALQASSPALDAGEGLLGLATDQRGFPRFTKTSGASTLIGGDNSDIGAFEFGNTALRITSIARPADGSIVIQGVGLPNALHTVKAAPNILTGFSALVAIFSDSEGNLAFQDSDAATFQERFYRFTYP